MLSGEAYLNACMSIRDKERTSQMSWQHTERQKYKQLSSRRLVMAGKKLYSLKNRNISPLAYSPVRGGVGYFSECSISGAGVITGCLRYVP